MSILRRFTNFILQGRFYACAIAFIFAYLPIVGSVGVLMAGLITLRKGALEGGLVFLAVMASTLLKYYGNPPPISTWDMSIAIIALIVFIATNSLMWLFAILLRRYASWSCVLNTALLLGVAIIGLIHFFYPEVKTWWGLQITQSFNKAAAMLKESQADVETMPAELQAQFVDTIKVYVTGLLVSATLFSKLLQLIVSRWWQALMFNRGGLRRELLDIRLSYVAGLLFLVCYPLSRWGNEIAMDMMPVVYVVLSAAGLSVAHCLVAAKKKWIGLVVLYAAAIVMAVSVDLVGALTLFSVIALCDIGLDLRRRFAVQS